MSDGVCNCQGCEQRRADERAAERVKELKKHLTAERLTATYRRLLGPKRPVLTLVQGGLSAKRGDQ